MLDDVSWFREIETCKVKGPDGYLYEPVWINPVDAASRDLKNGDVVKMYNERGIVLGGAYITERIMPGVVNIPQGAWYDPDEKGIDRGGCSNMLTKDAKSPGGAFCTNTTLVQVEKWLENEPGENEN